MTETGEVAADSGCLKGCGWIAAITGGGIVAVAILLAVAGGISAPTSNPERPERRESPTAWYGFNDVIVVRDEVPAPNLSTSLYKRSVKVVVSKCGYREDFEALHYTIRRQLSRPIRHSVVIFYYLPGQDIDAGMYARTTDPTLDWGFEWGTTVIGRPVGDDRNRSGREGWAMEWSTRDYVRICNEDGSLIRAVPRTSDGGSEDEWKSMVPWSQRLIVGGLYSVDEELPFMPSRNPPDDLMWTTLWTPAGLEFRVDAVDDSSWPIWYKVSFDEGTAVYWLNSIALLGKEITSHE